MKRLGDVTLHPRELFGDLREQYEEHYFGCSECAEDLELAAAFVENT